MNNCKETKKLLQDFIVYNQLPETQIQSTKLPIYYKPATMDELQPKFKSNIDKGFDSNEIKRLMENNLFAPSDVFEGVRSKQLDFNDYDSKLGILTREVGRQKAILSTTKNSKQKNPDKISELTKRIGLLQKYINRIKVIPEGLKTTTYGTGIYTQKRINAYKIDSNGRYGNLIIDLPKLFGLLRVIAHVDGKKVYGKQGDFDTIDLLTKRFRNKKIQ